MFNHVTGQDRELYAAGKSLSEFGTEQQDRFDGFKRYRAAHIDFPGCGDTLYWDFVQYCEAHINNITGVNQYVRYCNTFKKIYPLLNKTQKIAEAGGISTITKFLITKGYNCTELPGDFRYKIDHDADQFDVMFSLETLEHIKDQNSDKLADIVRFNFSGMKAYISEMARVLQSGGHLFLTTPNSNSLLVLERLLEFKPSFMSPIHVRELTKTEIMSLCTPQFVLENYDTMYSFGLLNPAPGGRRAKLIEALQNLQASTEDRGDNHFFHFKKP